MFIYLKNTKIHIFYQGKSKVKKQWLDAIRNSTNICHITNQLYTMWEKYKWTGTINVIIVGAEHTEK